MKKENLVLLALTVLTTVTTGCARNFAGTYTGTETISLTSNSMSGGVQPPTQAIPSPMTLIIHQSSSTLLTGTWNSQGQTGTFQGTATGDSITGIVLTMMGIPTLQNVNGMQGAYPQGIYPQGIYPQGAYPQGIYPQTGGFGTPGYNAAAQQGLCNNFMGNLNVTPNNQMTGMLMVAPSAQAQPVQNKGTIGGLTCSGSRTLTLSKSS